MSSAETRAAMTPQEIVRRINRLWLEGRVDPIRKHLHPEVVIVQPGFADRAVGADAAVASYEEYVSDASTLEFAESEYREERFDVTAVVSYRFEATYDYQGSRYRGSGRDVWVFERNDGRWLAVWRAMFDLDEIELEESADEVDDRKEDA